LSADVEIEVKLAVTDAAAVASLLEVADPDQLAGFASRTPVSDQSVIDRYFDTPDGRLAVAGARARIRTGAAGGAILALKHHGIDDGAVSARHEVEGPTTDALVPAGWPDSRARRELLQLTGGAPVVEVARLRQHRRIRTVSRGETTVELSLDHLEALDGERVVAARWELEAELKRGDRAALSDLAAALIRLPATAAPTGSKLGFALAARAASELAGGRR